MPEDRIVDTEGKKDRRTGRREAGSSRSGTDDQAACRLTPEADLHISHSQQWRGHRATSNAIKMAIACSSSSAHSALLLFLLSAFFSLSKPPAGILVFHFNPTLLCPFVLQPPRLIFLLPNQPTSQFRHALLHRPRCSCCRLPARFGCTGHQAPVAG